VLGPLCGQRHRSALSSATAMVILSGLPGAAALLESMAITSWRGCRGLLIVVGVGMFAAKRVCRQRAG
jgi:hypothetical protein